MTKNGYAHLALLAVALIYGANYSIAKIVLDGQYIGPLGFILMRVIAATSLFWLSGIGRPQEAPRGTDLWRLVLCGLLGVAVNQMFFFSGLARTTPIHAALIMVLTPMIVLLLGALITWRKLKPLSILGLLLASAGAAWLIGRNGTGLGDGDMIGDLMVAMNATSYALYLILVRTLMQRYSPMWVLRWVFLFGMFFVVFFGWQEVLEARWADFTWPVTLSFIYVLVFTTFLAYGLNAFALKKVAAITVSAYIYLQPVFAALIALIIGNDRLDINTLIAGVLIFGGVWLVSKQEERTSLE
jgi:drug/metabolite transporter (DMT)-like permease